MERIGRYEILEELGRGAMGAVYKARDPQIGRIVAIKVILTANLSPAEVQTFKQRFAREAQAAGKMSHAGIVTIHDIAEDAAGHPYLVMEFIEGITLEGLMEQLEKKSERMSAEQALDIGWQVARALDYAHRRGVIHRDVKPANILVTHEGAAKIADFGIAKMAGTQLTQTGHMLGTPAFMSPEQFSGETVDARSDLFSLGAILYWLLTGEKPFAGDSLTTVTFKIVFADPPPPRQLNPALPDGIDTVIERCLAKKSHARYASCRELAADLDALKHERPIAATPLPASERATGVVPVATGTAGEATAAGRTVAQAVAGAAGQTVVQPAPGAERTMLKARPPTGERTVMQTVAPAAEKPPRRWVLWAGVAAVLLLAVVVGGYMLWPAAPTESETSARSAQPTKEIEAPKPPPEEPPKEVVSAPPPAPKTTPKSRRSRAYSGPTATLNVDCRHNFHSATLQVYADDALLFEAPLKGEEQGIGPLSVTTGTVRKRVDIPAGERVLRVTVRARGGYSATDEIGGAFPEGSSRTLLIEFGKGSGLGVFERKLTLALK